MEDHELRDASTSYPCQLLLLKPKLFNLEPAPKNLAVFDSLLYTVADELVPEAICATFAAASEGAGDILTICSSDKI